MSQYSVEIELYNSLCTQKRFHISVPLSDARSASLYVEYILFSLHSDELLYSTDKQVSLFWQSAKHSVIVLSCSISWWLFDRVLSASRIHSHPQEVVGPVTHIQQPFIFNILNDYFFLFLWLFLLVRVVKQITLQKMT